MNFLKKYYHYFIIFSIWVIFASPYLFFGKVPYSSTYQVNHFAPWSSYEKYWGPVKNGAMPDITDQIYPWRYFSIQTLKAGQIPLWNPYNFSGNPHLANFQSAALSPFNVLFLILPFVDGWSVNVLLAPLFAGIFTYLFLREMKASREASIISSISFMFCGFITVWMAYGTLSLAISFLPLALFAVEKFLNGKKAWALLLLCFSIPLSFFSGHFQISLYFLLFLLGFIVFRSLNNRRAILPVILSIFFGLLISLPQLLPSIEFYTLSVRSNIFNTGGGIPWWHLVTFFSPDFFGNPVTRNDWMGSYAEWANFIGVIPFVLLFFSFFKKTRYTIFFWIVGLVTLILSVDSPLQGIIGSLKIPVLSTSYPSRIIVLASFSLSVLAGFGFDSFSNLLKSKNSRSLIKAFTLPAAILFITWVCIFIFNLSPEILSTAKRNMLLPTALFGFLFLGSLLICFLNKKKYILPFAVLLIALVAFDSLRFAQKWMPFDPRNLVFPDAPVLSAMKDNIGYGRIFGNLGAQVETYYGFPSIQGYDPLYVGRYGEFIHSGIRGEFLEAERSVVKLDKGEHQAKRVLDLLGVSLIFHPLADTNQVWAFPVWRDDSFKKIYEDTKFGLYQNTTAFERVKLFQQYEVIKEKEKIIQEFYSDNFDFRNKLILEEDPGLKKLGTGSAEVISYTPNKISARTNAKESSLLFLADNYYPGWKAYVDGKETKIYRADYAFRAVVVPKGEHEIVFDYDPLSFKLGIVGAIIGLIGISFLFKNKK